MRYIEAPNKPTDEQYAQILTKSIFLAGGISGCSSWQEEAVHKLSTDTSLFIINPRRKSFDVSNSTLAHEQIEWEYNMLNLAQQIMFWFCKETVQPITLYELGKELGQRKAARDEGYKVIPLYIGVHPLYLRSIDIHEQVRLVAPDIPIYSDLHGMLCNILSYNINYL